MAQVSLPYSVAAGSTTTITVDVPEEVGYTKAGIVGIATGSTNVMTVAIRYRNEELMWIAYNRGNGAVNNYFGTADFLYVRNL